MTIILSILAWILNPYHFIVNIFSNRNTKNEKETKVTRNKLCTPPRARPRLSRRDFRDENVRGRRFHSSPNLPSRLPKSFPRIRNPSEICLLGSNRATPFRPKDVSRTRRPNINLHGRLNSAFDPRFSETEGRDVAQEDLLIMDLPEIYTDRSSDANFHYDPAVEDRVYYMPSDGTLEFGEPLRKADSGYDLHCAQGVATTTSHLKTAEMRGRKWNDVEECSSVLPNYYTPKKMLSQVSLLGSNPNKFTPMRAKRIAANLQSGDINRRGESLKQDFRTVIMNKDSKLPLDFNPSSKDKILNDSSDGCDDLSRRYLQLKNNSRSTPGYFHQNIAGSRIPIRSCSRSRNSKSEEITSFPQGYRSLSTVRRNLLDFQENEGSADTETMKPNDLGNWITFRNDISAKFERMFKSLTKKKHQSTGNIIDSFLHIQWMQLAKLTADKDGAIFRNFAGGKVVLTFGEYKYLIHKICTAHELDYWEVMRKMATFGEEEF